MRKDELKQLNEQRLTLVQELRSHAETAEAAASDNGGEWLAEDKAKLDELETSIVKVNERLEAGYRVDRLARWTPEDAVEYGLVDAIMEPRAALVTR